MSFYYITLRYLNIDDGRFYSCMFWFLLSSVSDLFDSLSRHRLRCHFLWFRLLSSQFGFPDLVSHEYFYFLLFGFEFAPYVAERLAKILFRGFPHDCCINGIKPVCLPGGSLFIG